MFKNKFKYIIIFLIFYLIWAIAIPQLFKCNTENIQAIILKESGYNVCFTNPDLNLWFLPHAKIRAERVEVLNKDNSKALVIENPRINVRVLPLIIGKFHAGTIECSNIQANFSLDKDLYLGDYLLDFSKKINVKSKIDRIKISNYKISLLDKKSKMPVSLNGRDFYFKETRNYIIAHSNNDLIVGKTSSCADFDIKIPKRRFIKGSKVNLNIDNLQLKPFGNLIYACIQDDIKYISGVVNIKSNNSKLNAQMDNLKIIVKNPAKSIIFPDKLVIDSEFLLKSGDLNIKYLRADGGNVHASLQGEINKFTSLKPEFHLQINMPKSDVREIALLLPPVVAPTFNIYRLKMYPFYGFVEADLNINGKFPEPRIDGYVSVSDAYMIKPIPNAKKANINIKCIEKHMELDVVVPAAEKETVYVTGSIDDYGEYKADLRIRSTKSVDLATAEFVLNPLHEILRFLIGPVPIMNVTGKGNIDIRVIGTKRDPHIWGDFNFMNASASFNDIHHLVLKNASGNLNFNDRIAHFVNHTGTVENQPFKVEGDCSLFGDMNFNAGGDNLPLNTLIRTVQDSPMLEPVQKMVPNIKNSAGNIDFRLNLTGKLPDINYIKLNENLFAEGSIKLKNNSLVLNGIPVKRVSGDIKFKNLDLDLNITDYIDTLSKLNITGHVKNGIANITANSSRMNIREFTKDFFKELDDCYISLKASYKGKIDDIEIDKAECYAKVLKNNKPVKNIKVMSGDFELKNSKLKLTNFYGFIKHNPFNINLTASNISKDIDKIRVNSDVKIKNFDLCTVNAFINCDLIPKDIQKELKKLQFHSGNTDITAKIHNNDINAVLNLNNINALYQLNRPVPIRLINGQIAVKHNRLFLNKMNYLVDDMPVLIYGNVSNILKKPKFDIHINSKLSQRTFDKYWNADTIYPIKVRGDILLGSLITGTLDKLNTKMDFKLEENSSIYYMGATVGDPENPITVNMDFDVLKNNLIRLNKFQYSKLISSQNNKQNLFPLVTVKGGITYHNKKFYTFDNLTIKTQAPTDARIFNVIFRKPTIKHGQFTSDLRINGKSTSPKILGEMVINGLDMPFLNTTIKDLSLNFNDKDIIIQSKGEVLSNNVVCHAVVKNKFSSSYVVKKADIALKHLDINNLISELKQLELRTFNENQTSVANTNILNSVIFNDLSIHADSIAVRNIRANNLKADCSLNDKMQFAVDKFSFDIADGQITGSVKYNLLNNLLKLKLNANSVSANDLLTAVFDVPNQIFGKLTGTIEISTNVSNETTSKETLSGKALFSVKDGRMPKLGSLEYLLRAGNVFKSGITGITMNSIIDLVTPLKTGDFSSIEGNILINHGIAHKIEINSIGRDLNLFIKGKYNMVTQVADMQVLGQLSRKISTVFGAVGNLSLNSLFNKIPGVNLSENGQLINELNKIPGIELSNKAYRKFIVEIYGDINNDNNVKSFRWIN